MHAAARDYLHWYYDTLVWKQVSWRGVRTLKLPSDMWNYQEIIIGHDIQWVVEAGSRHGGSALFFADLLRSEGRKGRVISMDVAAQLDPKAAADPLIDFLHADSGAPETAAMLQAMLPKNRGPVFLILDSDHSAQHVKRELDVLVPILNPGDYLLVEDTVINGHPVRPDFGPGPMEAIREYIAAHPGALQHDAAREGKFGATFAAEGHYIKR